MLKFLGAELELDARRQRHARGDRARRGNRCRQSGCVCWCSSSRIWPIRKYTAARRRKKSGPIRLARSMYSSPASAPAAPFTGTAQVLKSRNPASKLSPSSRRTARYCPAASPARHKNPGHRRRLYPGYIAKGFDRRNRHHRQRNLIRYRPQSGETRRHSGRHFLGRDHRRGARSRRTT